jgi:hypothetical protein
MTLKEIPGTAKFLADEDGNIYSPDGKKRNTYRNNDGYVTASVLTDDNRWVTFGVHRLVALAHLIEDYSFDKCEVNHRDGNLENNKKTNLEWVTSQQNNIHSEIMREGNLYTTIIVEQNGKPFCVATNAKEASFFTGVPYLAIWDAIKDSKEIGNWKFIYRPFNGRIPKQLKRQTLINRGLDGRPIARAIKTLDVDNGDIQLFSSFAEAARHYDTNPSHLYQSIPTGKKVRLFRKKYQVSYLGDDFPEISKEDLERAKNHGPRETIAYNTKEKKYVIFNSAKEFIELYGLSKKAVTTALANNVLREIDSWIVTYFTDENVKRLKAYVEGPAFAKASCN